MRAAGWTRDNAKSDGDCIEATGGPGTLARLMAEQVALGSNGSNPGPTG